VVIGGATREVATMKEGQKYAVWLTDEAARAFLGIDAKQPPSRWVVLGECTGEESGVGFWVHVDHIEQWMAVGDSRTITVSPPACLIPWRYVITIQGLSEFKDLKVTGFKKN
jgi:hypothetical protein